MRTIPSSLFKSSTKDLSLPIFELGFSFVCQQAFTRRQCRSNFMILGILRNKFLKNLYVLMITSWEGCISPLSSMDSGLEAFSRNPTHGSFSALTFQSTELTNTMDTDGNKMKRINSFVYEGKYLTASSRMSV